ncbi:hypothetical protein MBLNU457_7698t1 [Dothideomycetes sp. NU457]
MNTFTARLIRRSTSTTTVICRRSPTQSLFRHHWPRLACPSPSQCRGAKTKTTIKVKDLPQGGLPPLPEHEKDDEPVQAYPYVIQQHLNNVKKFSDCVVLTRVGNFYEMYADQADEYGPLLNLKVAKRKTALGPVSMSGFQYMYLDRYLKLLVQDLNKQVAISDEIRNTASESSKSGGLLYDRKVNRVITAGTLIDENFMDPYENNFLLSIHSEDQDNVEPVKASALDGTASNNQPIGLSWVDLSSGDFYLQQTDMSSLSAILARIGPREIVLDTALEVLEGGPLQALLATGQHMLAYHNAPDTTSWSQAWNQCLDRPMTDSEMQISDVEIQSGSLLLDYVQTKVQDLHITLRPPIRRSEADYMRIDAQSIRGLEIKKTLRDGNEAGSLLHAIRRTVTKSGTRLLGQRLVSPSMNLHIINGRLGMVDELLVHESLREQIIAILRRSSDTLRLLQKFSAGRGDADDLLSLARSVEVMQHLEVILRGHLSSTNQPQPGIDGENALMQDMLHLLDLHRPGRLRERIQESIDEDNLTQQHMVEEADAAQLAGFAEQVEEAEEISTTVKKPSRKTPKADTNNASDTSGEIWIMRRDASASLRRAHVHHDELLVSKTELEESLRQRLGSGSLTLKWSSQFGHFCHVKGKDCKREIEGARNISTSKSTRSFYLADWTTLGPKIEAARARIRNEEQLVFASLRDEVIQNLVKLRRNAAVLDEFDVACSFAEVAHERNWTRPTLHEGKTLKVVGGRHPTVDLGLEESGRQFTANDCTMSTDEQLLLITGPNMAGKSTFLRQNALISILAQTGSYVPAEYAEIGLVDKIFSRIGSADNLYKHQSTFMVEMLEVAEILNQATSRSFVIMDEVGRGTTPEDGVAVGYACLHQLHEKIKCRALFATHFHALTDMTKDFARLACYCTDVVEASDGSWIYVHKLHRGVNRESHALKVARLAGMPDDAIEVARDVLVSLQKAERRMVREGLVTKAEMA